MSRRVAILASEILGMPATGGAATADSLLAVALGRHGFEVQILVAPGRAQELTEEWSATYRAAGVSIRPLSGGSNIVPRYLQPAAEILAALRADSPDVVIADDWRGLGYAALCARQLGIALVDTAFVVHCHGTARVLAEFARKVPDTLARFGDEVAERTSIELADAVVSPSAWLLRWMREHRWPIPESARVIPYVRQSAALDEPQVVRAPSSRVRRLAFFGQLREGKGIRIYLEALNILDPDLVDGVELAFLGRETKRWRAETIASELAPSVRERLAGIHFQTSLDGATALAALRQPGTLALMPSLLDNAPNTVSECIENGIPFLSTRTGGIPELVAAGDHERVLCAPTTAALAAALRRALEAPDGFGPATAARDPSESLQEWLELVDTIAPCRTPVATSIEAVDVVVVDDESETTAQRLATSTRGVRTHVVRAESRNDGLARASSEWVLFLDREDVPDDDLLDRLVAAQRTSGAAAVTCGVRTREAPDSMRLFLGDPRSLGLVENQYGVLGLVRRSLVRPEWTLDGERDSDWLLFAHLALTGARIVSVPEPLSTHLGRPGHVSDVPGEGLAVLEAFERHSRDLFDLPQLAATLAAAHARARAEDAPRPRAERATQRGLRVLREEGPRAVVRRVSGRLLPRR